MFGRGKKPPEPPPVPTQDDAPPGEAEKVEQVTRLCWVAGKSAVYLNPAGEDYQTVADAPEEQDYTCTALRTRPALPKTRR